MSRAFCGNHSFIEETSLAFGVGMRSTGSTSYTYIFFIAVRGGEAEAGERGVGSREV